MSQCGQGVDTVGAGYFPSLTLSEALMWAALVAGGWQQTEHEKRLD